MPGEAESVGVVSDVEELREALAGLSDYDLGQVSGLLSAEWMRRTGLTLAETRELFEGSGGA